MLKTTHECCVEMVLAKANTLEAAEPVAQVDPETMTSILCYAAASGNSSQAGGT